MKSHCQAKQLARELDETECRSCSLDVGKSRSWEVETARSPERTERCTLSLPEPCTECRPYAEPGLSVVVRDVSAHAATADGRVARSSCSCRRLLGEERNPIMVGTDRITVINLTDTALARRRGLAERPLPRAGARRWRAGQRARHPDRASSSRGSASGSTRRSKFRSASRWTPRERTASRSGSSGARGGGGRPHGETEIRDSK